ncbi:MAG: YebC/PmpR family DNA-binding transcriptional regulator [Candidatus Nealsonbacteria bacterium]|nr:YebC/PmpR family DNA-binding transcriptional regulator [Candidatus Nealsonbacteria bacterium]
MSGHSHFSTIKHKKQAEDQKRGKVFSKLSREISMAAKEKGKDPETNPKLRLVIEKAKQWNLPKDNIERAIKKGIGELKEGALENIVFESYGPGGIAIIIEGITDNRTRTTGEIKQILNHYQGKLTSPGSVKWMFERKIDPKSDSLSWIAKQSIEIPEQEKTICQKLFEALNENDAVQKIYSNLGV